MLKNYEHTLNVRQYCGPRCALILLIYGVMFLITLGLLLIAQSLYIFSANGKLCIMWHVNDRNYIVSIVHYGTATT